MRRDQIPTVRGTGENTPFAIQSRKKERDNGHNWSNDGYLITVLQHLAPSISGIGTMLFNVKFDI